MLGIIKKIVFIDWLWDVIAGFYLIAYTFWVPELFANLSAQLLIASMNLVIGVSLLIDGFFRALELEYKMIAPILHFKLIRRAFGAFLLFGYLLIYSLPGGRLVPHWPLDMLVTFLSGVIILAYAIWDTYLWCKENKVWG